ncbi:MAG TPA: hypothetical protein PL065_07900 [Polyangiaceae bacterium]|jgi:hypothetical protein|nr:hypothetical protein [Polyangiaceae bacterium]
MQEQVAESGIYFLSYEIPPSLSWAWLAGAGTFLPHSRKGRVVGKSGGNLRLTVHGPSCRQSPAVSGHDIQ